MFIHHFHYQQLDLNRTGFGKLSYFLASRQEWEEMGRANRTSLAQWNPYKVVRSVSSLTLPLEGGNTAKVKEFYAEDFCVICPRIYPS